MPEVAAGWPASLRRGAHVHVPDPARLPLLAAVERAGHGRSFEREIERVLSPRLQPGPWKLALLPDVVGAVAFHAGKSAHVSGVSAHGDMLVIRLVKPASDLPARLAEPTSARSPSTHPSC